MQGHDFASGFHLALAAAGACLGIGEEEELAGRIGKDKGALIAALGDHVAALGGLPLPGAELAAHNGAVGHGTGGRGHGGAADFAGHVLAVEPDAARRHLDAQLGEQLCEAVLVAQVEAATEARQCDDAIHGAGVEKLEAEALREATGGAALAGAGGAVDGDDRGASHRRHCRGPALRRQGGLPYPSRSLGDRANRLPGNRLGYTGAVEFCA